MMMVDISVSTVAYGLKNIRPTKMVDFERIKLSLNKCLTGINLNLVKYTKLNPEAKRAALVSRYL